MQRLHTVLSIIIKVQIILLLILTSDIISSSITNELDLLLNSEDLFSGLRLRRGKSYTRTENKNNETLLQVLQAELANPDKLDLIYNKFQKKYKKSIITKPQTNHSIFKRRLLDIANHNFKAKQGLYSYEKGVNHFTDLEYEPEKLTPTERRHRSGRLYQNQQNYQQQQQQQPSPWFPHVYAKRDSEKDFLDWRNYGAISYPKNQGKCGSCSFFATVAALESHNYLVNMSSSSSYPWGSPPDLSEQELLDCARNYSGYRGCNDNLPTTGLEYMKQNGLSFEFDYPYRDSVGSYCYAPWNQRKLRLDGYYPVIPSYNEERIKDVVRSFGPVIVGMHMSLDLKSYSRGIYDKQCTDPNGISHNIFRNHMVLIVGYGSEWINNNSKKVDYWIMKNSYGSNWGDRGYFRIERNRRLCLLGEEAYYLYSGSPNGYSL